MEKETFEKEEHYKALTENTKRVKMEAKLFAESNFAQGSSEFADGYNTAMAHFIEYLKR